MERHVIRAVRSIAFSLALAGAAACSIRDAACGRPPASSVEPTADQVAAARNGTTAPQHFKILFLGDSLTAGLGLLSDEGYPVAIQQKFATEGYTNVEVVNASVSGDTTAGGLERLDGVLGADTKILVLALGGNDALRGLPVSQTHDNLAKIIEAARDRNIMVLLAGMEAPTNLGEDYQQGFHAAFVTLSHDYARTVVYMPFLLEGVAGHPDLNQRDGIHPNKAGAALVAEHMYPKLRLIVDELGGGG
jgi:acyl-CoA thioesterase-1